MKNWWSYNLLLVLHDRRNTSNETNGLVQGCQHLQIFNWCASGIQITDHEAVISTWNENEQAIVSEVIPACIFRIRLCFRLLDCLFADSPFLLLVLLLHLLLFICFSCFCIFCCQVLSVFVQRFTITKAQQMASSISACRQEFHAARLKTLGKSNNPNKTVLVVDCERDDQIRWNQSISKHNFVWTHLILLAQCASSPNNERTEKARSRDFPLQCEPSKPRFLETVQ